MGRDKLLASCGGRPVLARTLESLAAAGLRRLVVGVREEAVPAIRRDVLAEFGPPGVDLVPGGGTRSATVARCLAALGPDVTHVVVHDAARPFCSPDLVRRVMAAARAEGAACAALRAVETVHRAGPPGVIAETLDRAALWHAQTPQAFRRDLLELSHRGGREATDDAGLAVLAGVRVRLVEGERTNVKITFPEDLDPPAAAPEPPVRVGLGHDVHRFAAGRPLVLGGVRIPHPEGLEGHSDADVLAHAVADAVLGAAGLGDLGRHFPPSDERWRGALSLALLRRCADLAAQRGWAPLQVDAVVVAEAPRLAPHASAMERNLAGALGLPADRVNVKAGTNEGMGAVGRGEGMAATAVVLLGRSG
jgi:2-C-methyl-D-erythritol 2,4-cyclodiphosphate synthase/2-C-methyl-D-erythritol 4-phosphate cytidylyltransferase